MNKMEKEHKNKGFTLLEVMLAIFIITSGVIGVFTTIFYINNLMAVSSSKLTAIYLAQEGLEIVRNIRDTNRIKGQEWTQGLTTMGCEYGCEGDYNTTEGLTAFNPDGRYLYIDEGGGVYGYQEYTRITNFKRKITIYPPVAELDPMQVYVSVYWSYKNNNYQVNAAEMLYKD